MRERIEFTDGVMDIMMKMSEGNPGATSVLSKLFQTDSLALMYVLDLDDMNIRGSQIWLAYKDYCQENMDIFLDLVKKRDENLVKAVNIYAAKQETRNKAVTHGASGVDQNQLLFTDAEMETLKMEKKPVCPVGGQMGE